jgi:hypothetical protein
VKKPTERTETVWHLAEQSFWKVYDSQKLSESPTRETRGLPDYFIPGKPGSGKITSGSLEKAYGP